MNGNESVNEATNRMRTPQMGNESANEATNQMSMPQMKKKSANETTKMITNALNNATKGSDTSNQSTCRKC